VFVKLRALGSALTRELRLYRLVLADRRTPRLAKLLLWLAVGYTLLPFDLIPDFIPVVGHQNLVDAHTAVEAGAVAALARSVARDVEGRLLEPADEVDSRRRDGVEGRLGLPPAFGAKDADEALRDDPRHRAVDEEGLEADVEQPPQGARRRVGVHRRHQQVAGERALDRDVHGLQIPQLADHDDVAPDVLDEDACDGLELALLDALPRVGEGRRERTAVIQVLGNGAPEGHVLLEGGRHGDAPLRRYRTGSGRPGSARCWRPRRARAPRPTRAACSAAP